MALLKSLNDSCRKDVQLQLQTYQLRRREVAANKVLLKQKAKAELTRPGTLAAVFTLGMLAAPGGKGKRGDMAERAARSEQRAAAAAKQATEAKDDAAAHAQSAGEQTTGKKQKDKSFDPLDIMLSVGSSIAVRLVTNWVTGLAKAPQGPESMQDMDVDTSTNVEL